MIAPHCPSTSIHGTVTAYTDHDCRCQAARDRMAERNYAAKATYPNLVDSTGTRRRVRALEAAGWPAAEIAERLDAAVSQVREWAQGKRSLVNRRSAEKVTALYGEVSGLPGWSARTAARSAEKGWSLPEQWVGLDMDDPAVLPWRLEDWDPVVVDRLMFGEAKWQHVERRERREAVRRLRAAGAPLSVMARRLRMAQRQVERDLVWLRRRGMLEHGSR